MAPISIKCQKKRSMDGIGSGKRGDHSANALPNVGERTRASFASIEKLSEASTLGPQGRAKLYKRKRDNVRVCI